MPFVTAYQPALAAYATSDGPAVLRRPGWAYLRWFHNGGARTYCPSRAAAAELRQHGVERLAIWTGGVDVDAFHPSRRSAAARAALGADHGTCVVASSARVGPGDGFDVACRVMRLVQQTTTRRVLWVVAGNGRGMALRAAAPPDTVFLGALDQRALATFHASADLFLSTATGATIGDGVLEAMASGVPVLAANSARARELLDGTRGATATAGDVESLALRLISLLGDARERAVLRDNALAYVRRHSWDDSLGDLVASFERITRHARAGARAARPSGEVPVAVAVQAGFADGRGPRPESARSQPGPSPDPARSRTDLSGAAPPA